MLKIINKSDETIETDNIIIHMNGLIEGTDFKTYDEALYSFMDILPKLRRNI